MSGTLLVRALRAPESLGPDTDWTGLLSAARAEQLTGTLAHRLEGLALPDRVAGLMAMHRADAARSRVQALWEAEMTRRALAPLGIPVVLLKGTAFIAAGLDAGIGRSTGDIDILVPRVVLDDVEAALIAHGWERLKAQGEYDDLYYRQWMHELPPLIHRERDRMMDVHHTILPPTARPTPDSAAMIAEAVALPAESDQGGLLVPTPEDMVVHAAAHLIADGDMAGGLRNLWDVDRLLRQFAADPAFWPRLRARTAHHQLTGAVARTLRLSARLYGTPVDPAAAGRGRLSDAMFLRRLFARDGWGREGRVATRAGFYLRGHAMRMPPMMLARHLVTKARMAKA